MDFNSFLTQLSHIENKPLGGLKSQFKMVPEMRLKLDEESILKRNPRESAVMALFYPDIDKETHFLLIKRPNYNGTHSGQISFPGGKQEEVDNSLLETSLRETYEESGVKTTDIKIIRELSKTYIPPSNFWVTPFLGYVNKTPKFIDNVEVEEFLEVKLNDLLDEKSLIFKTLSTSYMENVEVPCFNLNDQIVWGATAMILSEIKDLLK